MNWHRNWRVASEAPTDCAAHTTRFSTHKQTHTQKRIRARDLAKCVSLSLNNARLTTKTATLCVSEAAMMCNPEFMKERRYSEVAARQLNSAPR